jgi:DNA adenine methylase
MRPPFAYFGGKGRLAGWLAGLLPAHRAYIEPFCGSAAVLFAKPPAVHEILNDRHGAIVAFFRVLRDRPAELERACRLTPYARDEFAATDPSDPEVDDLERARLWWVAVNQSFNKSARARNGWSSSIACQNGEAKTVQARIARFTACADRLAGVTIENRDALDIIDSYGGGPDVLFYVDPPYLGETRQQGGYEHEYRTEAEHRDLATALHATGSMVVLSGYESGLYAELYSDWSRAETSILRRSSNRASGTLPHATEVIWSNRPLADGRLFGATP